MKFSLPLAAACIGLSAGFAVVSAQDVSPAPPSPVTLAVSGQWQGHRAYLDDFTNIVVRQWKKAIAGSKAKVPAGTVVTVEIILNSDGNVGRIEGLGGSLSSEARAQCQNSLTSGHSYGLWTEPMIKDLGTFQTMVVTFNY